MTTTSSMTLSTFLRPSPENGLSEDSHRRCPENGQEFFPLPGTTKSPFSVFPQQGRGETQSKQEPGKPQLASHLAIGDTQFWEQGQGERLWSVGTFSGLSRSPKGSAFREAVLVTTRLTSQQGDPLRASGAALWQRGSQRASPSSPEMAFGKATVGNLCSRPCSLQNTQNTELIGGLGSAMS